MERARINQTSLKGIRKRSLSPNEKRKYPYDGERITLESLDDKSLKEFLSSLTRDSRIHGLRSTPELSLFFSRCHNVTFIGQQALFKSIKQHFQDLSSLTMRFWASQGTTDPSLAAIGYEIGRSLPNLKRLKLILSECHSITDEGVKKLGQQLSRNLRDLETLEICFQHCREVTGESLAKLGSNISRNLVKLQSLALSFVVIKNVGDKHIEEFMSSFDGKLKNLRHLNLNFGISRLVTDEGFSILGKKIAENFQALDNLELVFLGFDITDQGVESLLCPIGFGLTKLKKLRFSLSNCKNVTNKSLETIGKEVGSRFLNLKSLQINLANLGGGVNGQGFEVLHKQLLAELKSLENLAFQTSGFEDVNFESLLVGLRALKELKRLDLNFSSNKKISRHSIANFLAQIQSEMTTLEDLSLDFSGMNSEDSSALKFEENNIFHTNLKSFSLNLRYCKDLSIEDAEELCVYYIGHFPNLEQLQLDFFGTANAATILLERTREMLIQLCKLKSLSLSFQFCKITIEEAQKLIRSISKALPDLETLRLTFSSSHLNEFAFADELQNFKCLKDYSISFV